MKKIPGCLVLGFPHKIVSRTSPALILVRCFSWNFLPQTPVSGYECLVAVTVRFLQGLHFHVRYDMVGSSPVSESDGVLFGAWRGNLDKDSKSYNRRARFPKPPA